MKAFVTGGTGLVGGNLIRELVEQGHQVKALVRKTSNTKAFDDLKQVERVEGDIGDIESLKRGADGCEVVFHSAAMVTMWAPDFERMRRINEDGTKNVLDAALAAGVRRVVHVSTVDAIGFNTPEGWGNIDKPSTEDIPGPNLWAKLPYMTTKWMAQELAQKYDRSYNLEVVIVNPTFMIGPYDVKPSSGTMVIEVAKGMAKAYTGGGNNFVHIHDVVTAMINAADRGKRGELYILGNENLFYKEIFTKIADVVGVAPPKFELPKAVSYTVGALGTAAGRLFGWAGVAPEAINYRTVKMGYVQHFFDSTKARRDLGLAQTPVEVAIEDAYKWFVDNGYLKK
jgi:dihydroflavonol-4-reductase